jgi:uncharacterized protein (DUF488 family)
MARPKDVQLPSPSPSIFTIGHSTRSIEEFIGLLEAHEIQVLVDVRRFPASRRYPHFNGPELARSLSDHDIQYCHMPALGGRRPSKPDSVNVGWRNASFRGYADYMQTRDFSEALEALMHLAKRHRTAIMCAEAVPWRCHRNLIADALIVKGWQVSHIMSASKIDHHRLRSFAQVSERGLVYPAETDQSSLF